MIRKLSFFATCSLLITLVPALPAHAKSCPSAALGGAPVGWVELDGVSVPVKAVNYPAGGQFDPPASNQVVGLSARHRPLLSKQGTTVLSWHVRYGVGCDGLLNPLMTKPLGSTFVVKNIKGQAETYKIFNRVTVAKGAYRPEWFQLDGDPRIALFTCTDLRQGKYRKTMGIFAKPISSESVATS